MKILPISYNNSVKTCPNTTSFGAVNPEYLKWAKEEFEFMNTVSGDLIERLQFDILMKRINKEDGRDTVKALYEYTKEKYHFLLDGLLNMHCLK